MRSIVILFLMNLFVFNQSTLAAGSLEECAKRQIDDFKRTSNLTDKNQRRNAVIGYIKRECNVDKAKAEVLLAGKSQKPSQSDEDKAKKNKKSKKQKASAPLTVEAGETRAQGSSVGQTAALGNNNISSTADTSSGTTTLTTSMPSSTAGSDKKSENTKPFHEALDECSERAGGTTKSADGSSTTAKLGTTECIPRLCANPVYKNEAACKKINGTEDDENSCTGLLKAYQKSLEDKDEACGKGPSAGSCIQDYMDCTSGVLKNKDVYDNVNDKLTDAMKLQALFKSAGTQAGIPGKTLDKCNMLSGRDFFAKKDKLEEKKKDLERDLKDAKDKILENQKNNAIEAQELKEQIANLKTEFEEKKKGMSEEMRNMTKSMLERSKELESKKKETALAIQKKNIEIMNMLNGYNKQLAMVTMNGSSAANCKMEMMKQKEILDKQKLGGNVGNSIQKKNLLTASFKTCMENLKKDLKLMQETFQKQKEIADTELINLNSTMSSYSEEIESSKRELEQFKKDHANELTTAEKSMMEKLMALAQRQQEQMQRTTQQNINDQELIKNYEAELRATTLEIMAMGNEEPSNREGDKNWPAVEDKIASARNKANDYYQACCLPDKEDAGKNSCKRLNDGDGSYKAVGKEGAKKVIPTNSTGSNKEGSK